MSTLQLGSVLNCIDSLLKIMVLLKEVAAVAATTPTSKIFHSSTSSVTMNSVHLGNLGYLPNQHTHINHYPHRLQNQHTPSAKSSQQRQPRGFRTRLPRLQAASYSRPRCRHVCIWHSSCHHLHSSGLEGVDIFPTNKKRWLRNQIHLISKK